MHHLTPYYLFIYYYSYYYFKKKTTHMLHNKENSIDQACKVETNLTLEKEV
jgi:hypothetical protein